MFTAVNSETMGCLCATTEMSMTVENCNCGTTTVFYTATIPCTCRCTTTSVTTLSKNTCGNSGFSALSGRKKPVLHNNGQDDNLSKNCNCGMSTCTVWNGHGHNLVQEPHLESLNW